ncbi:MAG: AraC family transcriptional regulator [Pseudomonadota bacterium]
MTAMENIATFKQLKSLSVQLIDGKDQNVTPVQPNLSVFRWREEETFNGVIYEPVVCIVLAGRKEFFLKEKTVSHQAGDAFVISHNVPLLSGIRDAAPKAPYLSLVLTLNFEILYSLRDQVFPNLTEDSGAQSLSSGPFDKAWAEPLYRYLRLAENPLEAEVLGPLILKEVHFKLLMSPIGGMLRNLCLSNSKASQIASVIAYIKGHFHEPLVMAELAKMAGMSTSMFFYEFKSVTGHSPLQYQKNIRLIKAQNMLCLGNMKVSSVALEVGYESPSHFSRDYTMRFGVSPKKHIVELRGRAGLK